MENQIRKLKNKQAKEFNDMNEMITAAQSKMAELQMSLTSQSSGGSYGIYSYATQLIPGITGMLSSTQKYLLGTKREPEEKDISTNLSDKNVLLETTCPESERISSILSPSLSTAPAQRINVPVSPTVKQLPPPIQDYTMQYYCSPNSSDEPIVLIEPKGWQKMIDRIKKKT